MNSIIQALYNKLDFYKYLFFLCLCFSTIMASSQKVLLIETVNDPKNIKVYEGQTIEYKLIKSDAWFSGKIETLMVEEETIVFTNGIVNLDEITHIRRYRNAALYIGRSLEGFGAGWLVFGTLGAIREGNSVLQGVVLVPAAGSIFFGWLIRKLFYKRTLDIGARYRLRLVDLTM